MKFDLETTPLEIKTDSAIGSKETLNVKFLTSQGVYAGNFIIYFTSTIMYRIFNCNSVLSNFPTGLPAADEKVWRITKTKTSDIRLQIHCNNVEVLNTIISDKTCSNDYSKWIKWAGDVKKMCFYGSDTASDFYRPAPGKK